MKNVAGVIYPVDVQSLVIQGIVAIHIGIGVMDNSMDVWSLVQSVESSWDTSLVISPPLQSRPKSAPLQHEPLPQGPRLVSPFQVSATSAIGCSGQSSAQRHPGILRVSDLNQGGNVPPPQQFPVDSIRIVPGVTPLRIPPQNLPVIRSWTTLQQNVELPQPQGCLGYSESVPIDFVPNRPFSELLHPPRRQQGAISRVRFSSASPVLCQMWFDLLSQLGPLSRIWQETSMSQHHRVHLNRILDNVAPGTAMKYISSCKSFFKTCKALQVDLTSLTEVQLADILITISLSRSTSHGSSSCSSVIKALQWLMTSTEVGCLQVVHSIFIGTFLNQKAPRDRKQAPPLPL